jgi:hypothetical protein
MVEGDLMKRAAKKKSKTVPLSFRLPFETKRTLEEIAKCASVSVDQVVTVIIATRIVTERDARKVKP